MEELHCRWSTAFFRGDIERALAESKPGKFKMASLGMHERNSFVPDSRDRPIVSGLAKYHVPLEGGNSAPV